MNLRTSLIIVILLGLLVTICQADTEPPAADAGQDVILLKNGGRLHGKIIESSDTGEITILTREGATLQVPGDKIEMVTTEAEYKPHHQKILERLAEEREGRPAEFQPCMYSRLGLAFGDGETAITGCAIGGALMHQQYFVGLGLGYDHYEDSQGLSLLAEFVKPLRDRTVKVVPFLYADAGYTFIFVNDVYGGTYGGMTGSIGLGGTFHFGGNTRLTLQAGYRSQATKLPLKNKDLTVFMVGIEL